MGAGGSPQDGPHPLYDGLESIRRAGSPSAAASAATGQVMGPMGGGGGWGEADPSREGGDSPARQRPLHHQVGCWELSPKKICWDRNPRELRM